MSRLNDDGNMIGRLGALALLLAAGFGLRELSGSPDMCPVVKTDSCCSGMSEHASAEAPEPAPEAVPAK